MSLPRAHAVRPVAIAVLALALIGVGAAVAPSSYAAASPTTHATVAAGPYDPIPHTTTIPVVCEWGTPAGTGDPHTWVTSVTMRATYPDRVRFGGRFDITDVSGSFTYGGSQVGTGVGVVGRLLQDDRDGEGIFVTWMQGSASLPANQVDVAVLPLQAAIDARGNVGQAMDFPLSLEVQTFYQGWGPVPNGPVPPPPTTILAAVSCAPAPGAPAVAHVVIDPPEGGGLANDHVTIAVTRADGTLLHAGGGFLEGVGNDIDYWYGREGLISTVTGGGTFHAADGSTIGLHIDSSAATTPTGFWTPIAPPTQLLLLDDRLGQIILVTNTPGQASNGIFLFGGSEGGGYPERTISAVGAARGTAYPSGESVIVYWAVRNLR